MQCGGFPITDLSTTPPTPLKINDLTGRVNRAPSPGKRYITILPRSEPVIISVPFTRGGSYEPRFRPQPWEIVRLGRVVDEHGKVLQARRSTTVSGCDGLEPGKSYKATVDISKLTGRSWWRGTAADVEDGTATKHTFEEDGEELQLPLHYEVQDGGVEFDVYE